MFFCIEKHIKMKAKVPKQQRSLNLMKKQMCAFYSTHKITPNKVVIHKKLITLMQKF